MNVTLSVRHQLGAKEPSLNAGRIYGQFGIDAEQGERVYVDPFRITVADGQVILFAGTSGGGKTSCLRQLGEQLVRHRRAVWIGPIPNRLPEGVETLSIQTDRMVIDQLGEDFEQAVRCASACGLAEAQLMVRYPHELSDGQRYRFQIAKALAEGYRLLLCDEFLATLDRTTAKVIAYNVRKLATASSIIVAAATTHEDLFEDLQPDIVAHFEGREARVSRHAPVKKKISFYEDLYLARGSRSDWHHFSGWHYRGHEIGFVKEAFVLWHGSESIGWVSYSPPALANAKRNEIFGRTQWSGQQINKYFVTLSRVVLDPRYRGAGIAGEFVAGTIGLIRPVRFVEAIMSMGTVSTYWKRAGFRDMGPTKSGQARTGHYGAAGVRVQTTAQSLLAQMRYYFLDLRTVRRDAL